MSITDFKEKFENGKFTNAFESIIENGVISEENIYKLANKLRENEIKPVAIVELFCYLLEKMSPQLHICAFKLSLMAIRSGCYEFTEEFISRSVMVAIQKKISVMDKNLQKDVLTFLHALHCSFSESSEFECLHDLYKILKAEGYLFPAEDIKINLDNISPAWIDAANCNSCQCAFTTFNRKHHCRNCGNVFCKTCSLAVIELPHYFRPAPSRVCLACFETLSKWKSSGSIFDIIRTDKLICEVKSHSVVSQPLGKSISIKSTPDEDLDLKLAIELSLKEAEENNKKKTQQIAESAIYYTPSTFSADPEYANVPSYPYLKDVPQEPHIYEEVITAKHYYPLHQFVDTPQPNLAVVDNDVEYHNMVSTIQTLKKKISQVQNETNSVKNKKGLHTIFQASIGIYDAFQVSRDQCSQEIEKHKSCLQKLDDIEKLRLSLNETRKKNSRRISAQKQESETLMRMHMKQKLYLEQQQDMEFQECKKMLNEQRAKQLESGKPQIQQQFQQNYTGPSPQQPYMMYAPSSVIPFPDTYSVPPNSYQPYNRNTTSYNYQSQSSYPNEIAGQSVPQYHPLQPPNSHENISNNPSHPTEPLQSIDELLFFEPKRE